MCQIQCQCAYAKFTLPFYVQSCHSFPVPPPPRTHTSLSSLFCLWIVTLHLPVTWNCSLLPQLQIGTVCSAHACRVLTVCQAPLSSLTIEQWVNRTKPLLAFCGGRWQWTKARGSTHSSSCIAPKDNPRFKEVRWQVSVGAGYLKFMRAYLVNYKAPSKCKGPSLLTKEV